jgi:hypothetical protein
MSLIKQINSILKERKIEQTASGFALTISEGRTKRIEKLTNDELKKLLETLTYFEPLEMVKNIYIISFEIGIIPTNTPTPTNDLLIIEYCKHLKKIVSPLSNNSYFNLFEMADFLGKAFLNKYPKLEK